jgi:hypothetical protein
MSMSHGQLCRQTYRVRHRDELREAQRRYNREHSAALTATKRKRDDYIDRIVREIELNDDPESLFYVESFVEVSTALKLGVD